MIQESVLSNAKPFTVHIPESTNDIRIGIAKGEFIAPDDIDKYNDEIADMFDGAV